jgi:response regulator RpfG family c-di-GMP phosphodiesterase
MGEKILFVDDEPAVLDGYQRSLRREFEIELAVGGEAALDKVAETGPYAVVVSDMRMPVMDGIQLFNKIRIFAPDSVRIMLTGNTDVDTAINAVNEGRVFRFLTKPTTKETLTFSLNAGLEQYRLVTAEKELLEKTLSGSIRVLTEVLSLVNPAAFSRSLRVRQHVHHLANKLDVAAAWRLDIAAMMSQLGCVTLSSEMIDDVFAGKELPPRDRTRYNLHPKVARDLLSNIPRMEPIAWMIAQQNDESSTSVAVDALMVDESVKLGAQILRAALAFDELLGQGISKKEALLRLSYTATVPPTIINALEDVELDSERMEVRRRPVDSLAIGMILEEDVRTRAGMLMVAKGQEITQVLLAKLNNLNEQNVIPSELLVFVPQS